MAHIIGLTGEKLGGKDTAAEYLITKHGAYHARHSHILDDILNLLNVPISRRNEIDLAMALRGLFGTGIVGQALQKRILTIKNQYPLIVMNGIRFQEEIDYLNQAGGILLYITAPVDVRYERYLHRNEKTDDTIQTKEQFIEQELEPTEQHIASLGKQAQVTIENTGTVEELYAQLDSIINQLT